jgi:hypothetical protein
MDGIGRSGLHLSGILIAALFLAAWLMEDRPLVGERPAPGDHPKGLIGQAQDVPARLWEDPFAVVRQYRSRVAAASPKDGRGATGAGAPETGQSLETRWRFGTWEMAVSVSAPRPREKEGSHGDKGIKTNQEIASRCAGTPKEDREHSARELLERILHHAGREVFQQKPGVDMVFVSVSEAHWAEAKEHRLRARYALLSSFFERRYEPLENEHIGYWCLPWKTLPGEERGAKLLVPFEGFLLPTRAGAEDKPRLAVLFWVPEEAIQDHPLAGIATLSKALADAWGSLDDQQQGPSLGPPASAPLEAQLTYIGPQTSGTLGNLFKELCEPAEDAIFEQLKNFGGLRIISSNATRDSESLLPTSGCTLTDQRGEEVDLTGPYLDLRAQWGLELLRSIVTDDQLMSLALAELRLRNVDPLPRPGSVAARGAPDGGDHVVVISELDTAYGRALPRALRDALRPTGRGGGERRDEVTAVPTVLEYGYLRGLDGLAGRTTAEGDAERRPADLRALAEHARESYIEPAIGSSQFDYLRRMANRLREVDERLRREGKGGIRAFGILGNDHYDKLLILQALREHFPDQHYFTNDLDARLLNPSDFPAVRNLIVLSSFNLRLAEPWQSRVPPFRTHYQTSLFLAGMLIGNDDLSAVPHLLEPQVFEIGHGHFYRLETRGGRAAQGRPPGEPSPTLADCLAAPGECPLNPPPWEYPSPLQGRGWMTLFVAALSLVLAWLIVPGFWSWTRVQVVESRVRFARLDEGAWWRPWRYLAVPPIWVWILLFSIGVLWVMYAAMGATLEPFVPAGGVSIWPAELIRTAAGLIAAYLIYSGWQKLKENDDALEDDYRLAEGKRLRSDGADAATRGDDLPRHTEGACAGLRALLGWINERRPLSRRKELEIQMKRILKLLRSRKASEPPPKLASAETGRPDFRGLWATYRRFTSWSARCLEAAPVFAVLYALGTVVTIYAGTHRIHNHRASCPDPDASMTWLNVWDCTVKFWPEINGLVFLAIPFGLLIVGVIQEVLLCNRLIKEVRDISLSDGVWRPLLGEDSGNRENYLLTIFFIARRTETTSDVVWYPLVVWALVTLSMSTRFDNFEPANGILFMLALAFFLSLAPLFLLRRTAQRVRDSILDALKNDVFSTRREQAKTTGDESQVIIDRIKEIHTGAFRPWYQEPVMQVLFWLLSFGALVITEYLRVSG